MYKEYGAIENTESSPLGFKFSRNKHTKSLLMRQVYASHYLNWDMLKKHDSHMMRKYKLGFANNNDCICTICNRLGSDNWKDCLFPRISTHPTQSSRMGMLQIPSAEGD